MHAADSFIDGMLDDTFVATQILRADDSHSHPVSAGRDVNNSVRSVLPGS